ncbi:MAG: hypothetical protein QW683_08440 [Candidatus Caldarchaeum sp.]
MRKYTISATLALIAALPIVAADDFGSRERVGRGTVNWSVGYIEAKGEGAFPRDAESPGQARLMAKRAAILDAQRNLVETLSGVRLTAETVVKNFLVQSDVIQTRVQGYIQGAVVVKEQQRGDSYEVVLRMPLNGVAATAIEAAQQPELYDIPEERVQEWSPPKTEVKLPKNPPKERSLPPSVRSNPARPYTGVIIDARGLGMLPCMSPKIRREDGTEVWGTLQVSPEVAIEYGIAAWLQKEDDLKHPNIQKRIGSNPMFIRARGIAGAKRGDAVLTNEDTERLLKANQGTRFLEKMAVVFLY